MSLNVMLAHPRSRTFAPDSVAGRPDAVRPRQLASRSFSGASVLLVVLAVSEVAACRRRGDRVARALAFSTLIAVDPCPAVINRSGTQALAVSFRAPSAAAGSTVASAPCS